MLRMHANMQICLVITSNCHICICVCGNSYSFSESLHFASSCTEYRDKGSKSNFHNK